MFAQVTYSNLFAVALGIAAVGLPRALAISEKDVILGIRSPETEREVLVNLGPIDRFTNAAVDPFLVGSFDDSDSPYIRSQIEAVFGDWTSLHVSIQAVDQMNNRMWFTKSRPSLSTQSSPPNRHSERAQIEVRRKQSAMIEAVSLHSSRFADPLDSVTLTILPDRQIYSGHCGSGATGGGFERVDLAGTYWDDAQVATPMVFTESVLMDFYQIDPGQGPASLIGFFELSPTSELRFTPNAPPTAVPDTAEIDGTGSLRLRIDKLLANDYDPDHDSLFLIEHDAFSQHGFPLYADTETIVYSYDPYDDAWLLAQEDSFTYTISDSKNRTSVATVRILPFADSSAANRNVIALALVDEGHCRVTFAGIPSLTYFIQATGRIDGIWEDVAALSANNNGTFYYTDRASHLYSTRFYRTRSYPTSTEDYLDSADANALNRTFLDCPDLPDHWVPDAEYNLSLFANDYSGDRLDINGVLYFQLLDFEMLPVSFDYTIHDSVAYVHAGEAQCGISIHATQPLDGVLLAARFFPEGQRARLHRSDDLRGSGAAPLIPLGPGVPALEEYADTSPTWSRPFGKRRVISGSFGEFPGHGRRGLHFGVDFLLARGGAVYAAKKGVVANLKSDRVTVDHGNGYATQYLHVKPVSYYTTADGQTNRLAVDQVVEKGTLIANVNEDNHLHFEIIDKDGQLEYERGVSVPLFGERINFIDNARFEFSYPLVNEETVKPVFEKLWITKDNPVTTLLPTVGPPTFVYDAVAATDTAYVAVQVYDPVAEGEWRTSPREITFTPNGESLEARRLMFERELAARAHQSNALGPGGVCSYPSGIWGGPKNRPYWFRYWFRWDALARAREEGGLASFEILAYDNLRNPERLECKFGPRIGLIESHAPTDETKVMIPLCLECNVGPFPNAGEASGSSSNASEASGSSLDAVELVVNETLIDYDVGFVWDPSEEVRNDTLAVTEHGQEPRVWLKVERRNGESAVNAASFSVTARSKKLQLWDRLALRVTPVVLNVQLVLPSKVVSGLCEEMIECELRAEIALSVERYSPDNQGNRDDSIHLSVDGAEAPYYDFEIMHADVRKTQDHSWILTEVRPKTELSIRIVRKSEEIHEGAFTLHAETERLQRRDEKRVEIGKHAFSTTFDMGIPLEITGPGKLASVQGYSGVGHEGNAFGGAFLLNKTGGSPEGRRGASSVLQLGCLPPHESVSLKFLLAINDTWDGNSSRHGPDFFNVLVDGKKVFHRAFTWKEGIPAGVFLGNGRWFGNNFGEDAYDMGLLPGLQGIPHQGETLKVEWFADGGGWQGGEDESWAIDNVTVLLNEVSGKCPCD